MLSASCPQVSLAPRVLQGSECCHGAPSPLLSSWDVYMAAGWLLGSCPCGTVALGAMPKGIYSDHQ